MDVREGAVVEFGLVAVKAQIAHEDALLDLFGSAVDRRLIRWRVFAAASDSEGEGATAQSVLFRGGVVVRNAGSVSVGAAKRGSPGVWPIGALMLDATGATCLRAQVPSNGLVLRPRRRGGGVERVLDDLAGDLGETGAGVAGAGAD